MWKKSRRVNILRHCIYNYNDYYSSNVQTDSQRGRFKALIAPSIETLIGVIRVMLGLFTK
jgi:hypothetical protein